MNNINMLDLFSGTGGFAKGFQNAGFTIENHFYSEIDKHAIANYKYNFKDAKYVGSITDFRGQRGQADIVTFGSPCFSRGTQVLTEFGFKDIECVNVGDRVLTHTGNFKKVTQKNEQIHDGYIHTIKFGKDTEAIKCTPEHPFFVRQKMTKYNSKKRRYYTQWSEPFWVEAKDLSSNHYVVTSTQKEEVDAGVTKEEAYFLGYYLAEGYLDKTKRRRDGKPMFRIFFSMNNSELNHFENLISSIPYKGRFRNKESISFYVDENFEGEAIKCIVSNERLYNLCKSVGRGVANKIIPGFILSANIDIQKSFLDGYMFGDGCFIEKTKQYQAQSMNVKMAYGLRHLVKRVYKELATIYLHKPKRTKTINGRIVNQNNQYLIRWKKEKQREVFSYSVDEDIVTKILQNEKTKTIEPVFNFTVEGDNTYTVGNYVVHNCQDFSLAGKRKGLDGSRSGLISEAIRVVTEIRPSIFIWENVKGTFSSNSRADFWAILQAFTNIGGYRLEWQLLNTKWVLPQNRERVYLIGHLATCTRGFGQVFPIEENDGLFATKNRAEARWKQTENSTSLTGDSYRATNTFIKYNSAAGSLTGGGNSGGLHSDMETIKIGAIRGRNPEHPTDKEAGRSYVQMLEINESGVSNTLSSVQKDNVVVGTCRTNNNSSTIPASPREDGSGQSVAQNDSNIRRLTEIECERLQGFPDNWTQLGIYDDKVKPISATQRYKMLGNAVTVDVVELIAKRLLTNK